MIGDFLLLVPIFAALAGITIELVRRCSSSSRLFLTQVSVPALVPACLAFIAAALVQVFPRTFGALYFPGYCVSWPSGAEHICSLQEWLVSDRQNWVVMVNLAIGAVLLVGYPLLKYGVKKFCAK